MQRNRYELLPHGIPIHIFLLCFLITNRATLPLTDNNKDKVECKCPLSSHNNGSSANASNVVTNLSSISNIEDYGSGMNDNCVAYNNGLNQNGSNVNSNGDAVAGSSVEESRRHNSMDRLMGLLSDMGSTQRTRSLSDGGREEGKPQSPNSFLAIHSHLLLFFISDSGKRNPT